MIKHKKWVSKKINEKLSRPDDKNENLKALPISSMINKPAGRTFETGKYLISFFSLF